MKALGISFAVAILLVLPTQGAMFVASQGPLTADVGDLTQSGVDIKPVYTPDYARAMFVEESSRIAIDGAGSTYAMDKENRPILFATAGALDYNHSDSDDTFVAGAYSVLNLAPEIEGITGPANGIVQAPYTFSATVGPANVKKPITYIWEASGQSEVITHTHDSLSDTVTFAWDTPGVQIVSVTARNDRGEDVGVHPMTIFPVADFPFYDDFDEPEPLIQGWSVITTAQGRVRVSDDYGPCSGTYHVLLDDAVDDGTFSTAAIILTIDLAGQSDLDLDFWWQVFEDDNDSQDGVFISDNYGAAWYRVFSFTGESGLCQYQVIDLDAEAAVWDLALNDHFQIKFQFHDNNPIPGDGYAIDKIRVTKNASPTRVNISGSTTGYINTPYVFTATVNPPTVTLPITYVWQATGQKSITNTIHSISDTRTYTWSMTGTQVVTVTATNAEGTDTDTHDITITSTVPLTDVVIHGPTIGSINTDYIFTAVVSPVTATPPITYTWSPPPKNGQGSAIVTYTWETTGTKTIVVTATNAGGTDTDTHDITITSTVPLTDVVIHGPTTGSVNTDYIFTATVSPPTATPPITYTWSPPPEDGQGSAVVTYTWETSGTRTIAVTATNAWGTDTDTHDITIEGFKIALPMLMRCWPSIQDVPTLYPIVHPDDNASYTVGWSPVEGATTYTLEEATDGDFSDATPIYTGPSTSRSVNSRCMERYYYRVKACNGCMCGDWSNAQSVEVRWECEPNNSCPPQADDGPIESGLTYYGTFPNTADVQDYFSFYLPNTHTIELWLTNIPAGYDYDVALRSSNCDLVAHSDNFGNADEHILTDALPGGWYYVQVYYYQRAGSLQPYHLRVVYE